MTEKKWAYDYDNPELMEMFWKTLARAAVSGSGLVIDCTGGSEREDASYLHGVLLSRLESKLPPFVRGDRVHISPQKTYYCGSVNVAGEYRTSGSAEAGKEYEVWRVFYEKHRKKYGDKEEYTWTLSFKGKEEYRFPAERFEKVEQKELAVA